MHRREAARIDRKRSVSLHDRRGQVSRKRRSDSVEELFCQRRAPVVTDHDHMRTTAARLVCTSVCAVLMSMVLTACRTVDDDGRVPAILLFHGTGVSPGGIGALKRILISENLSYSTVDSRQLNGMS